METTPLKNKVKWQNFRRIGNFATLPKSWPYIDENDQNIIFPQPIEVI